MVVNLHLDNWTIKLANFLLKPHLASAIYYDSQSLVSNRQFSMSYYFSIANYLNSMLQYMSEISKFMLNFIFTLHKILAFSQQKLPPRKYI